MVGADDTTIDLNGHTISGDGNFQGDIGILNFSFGAPLFASFDRLTVKNGTISGFGGSGIVIVDSAGSAITNVHFIGNGVVSGSGVNANNADGLVIRRTTARGNPSGISVGGDDVTIVHSKALTTLAQAFQSKAAPALFAPRSATTRRPATAALESRSEAVRAARSRTPRPATVRTAFSCSVTTAAS